MSSNDTAATAASPRRCHVVKVPDFDGYGFNLHAEKGKPGQYIGKVDDASPAERAGLRQGDRIIEVNGVNIGRETHKEVVQRIKAIANEVQLLVVDASVTVSKDNRIVDVVVPTKPVEAVVAPEATTTKPLDVVGNGNGDIEPLVRPPSPASESAVRALAADTVDHAVAAAAIHVADVQQQQQQKQQQQNGQSADNLVPITIRTDNAASAPASANAVSSSTSTFTSQPSSPSSASLPQTNGSSSKFISTATFIANEQEQAQQEQQHSNDEAEDDGPVVHVINAPSTNSTRIELTHTTAAAESVVTPAAIPAPVQTKPETTDVTTTAAPSSSSPPPPSVTAHLSADRDTFTVAPKSPVSISSQHSSSSSSSQHQQTLINSTTTTTINNHVSSNSTVSAITSTSTSIINNNVPAPQQQQLPPLIAPAAPQIASAPTKSSPTSNASSGLNLNMTVAELRAKLAAKKKFDPKNEAVDLRKKYEIVEKL